MDISTGILAIFTGRTCETDMAFAILSGNGDCILARLAVFARRTDGNLAIDAILAVEADAGFAICTLETNGAIDTSLAQRDFIVELQIIGDLTCAILLLSQEQIAFLLISIVT